MTIVAAAGKVDRMRSAVPSVNNGASAQADWLVCRTSARLCAILIEHVVETMRVLPIEPVSRAPQYVRGLCIIRGLPVLVVDPGLLFGGQATQVGRLIVIRTGARSIALAVEAVLDIRTIEGDIFNRLPPLLRDAATDSIDVIGTLDAELLFVLSTARIVPDELFDHVAAKEVAP